MRIRSFFASVALVPSLANAAGTPVHLAPSAPWAIDYAENSCRLVRHFGEGADETTLAFESEAPGALDMMIVGKPVATRDEMVFARFVPGQRGGIGGSPALATNQATPALVFSHIVLMTDDEMAAEAKRSSEQRAHPHQRPPALSLAESASRNAEREAFTRSATSIEVLHQRDVQVVFDTGPLGDAFKVFDQCTRDSLRDWGLDPDVEDKIVRPVWTSNSAAWFSDRDYPREMVARNQESRVKVRLLVNAAGRVTKCTALSHFDQPEFNRITCAAFVARAHFEPAELSDGTKVPSYYLDEVVFILTNCTGPCGSAELPER
jgi:hypothetical protein